MKNDNVKLKNEKKVAIILVNYKDYADKYLADCLASIERQDYTGGIKFFLTDNKSTEESYSYLKNVLGGVKPFSSSLREGAEIPPTPARKASLAIAGGPFVKGGKYEIIRNKDNDGFAKGNNDAIKRALEQGFDYVILFNLDTVLETDCVRKMIQAVGDEKLFLDSLPVRQADRLRANDKGEGGNDNKEIGAVQARLMLWPKDLTLPPPLTPPRAGGGHSCKGEGLINSLGNVTHFLGFGYTEAYGEKYNPPSPPCQGGAIEICYPSGAAVLFKAEVLKRVGLFDQEFWMYNEDQDLGWRLWLAGYKCVLAPQAVVYHKYEFSRSVKKYYWLDRNRIIAILKNYHWLTLILILPSFALMEIGLIFFAYKNGWFYEKIKVYSYFLNLANWRKIMAERKKSQALRTVEDSQIVKMFSGKIWYQEIGETRLKVANIIFNAYWQIAKIFIRW